MIQFLFGIWAVADLISEYFTGQDTVMHLMNLFGIGYQVSGDSITLEWGMPWADFLILNMSYIICIIAVILLTFWISLRPFDSNGKVIWSISRAHKIRKERRMTS